ncbi:MAG: phenylacetate-CoA oxygenase subunit PaaC [Betaproteobacteria bacterium]|nr:phenylacetate-CoA oxygenase subunit PaaC [Betaproteobacteria bacterium]MDE2122896.1 phenylacetate-CoA oxygenase subunit PaaC [Betaproteobacteria bacterium]MDE2186419.1 phenylacetate-CoA oxygenase subunit PaaC [Betaproteobacteria bacterium]MDE2325216.1 phenylacetate-CoA oxygenase subunit PaaC [Betaproteobacteria bacterium]
MQDSIKVSTDPSVRYLLRLGDTCLVHAQRLGEWCGHAPIIEEDIALTNIALDLIGQARGILTRAGQLGGQQFDEDQLAFLREERDYLNPTLVELPRGDFAVTTVRNLMVAALLELLWTRLQASSDTEVAAVAGKAVKEARYHHRHAADWLVRLGDGTAESRRRIEAALDRLWPYSRELFQPDAIDDAALASDLGPRWAELRDPWLAAMRDALDAAGLGMPAETAFLSSGRMGIHSEHMGHMLAEMQYLQRSYPGGAW